jgi:hypothetical protein
MVWTGPSGESRVGTSTPRPSDPFAKLAETMPPAPSPIRVFVSSTSEDLKPFRAAARDAILKMGWSPVMMEYFGSSPKKTVQACRERLSTCRLMLLIQAFRRGWVPTLEQGGDGVSSITALEVEHAKKPEHPVPILTLLANETWPGNHWEENDDGRKWVGRFRANLNLPAEFFDYEDPSVSEERRLPNFRSKVSNVLGAYRERIQQEAADASVANNVDVSFKAEQKRSDVLRSERLVAYKALSTKLLALRRYCEARVNELRSGSEFAPRTENLPHDERKSILQHYELIRRELEERELIVSPCSRQRFAELFSSMNWGMTIELHADYSPSSGAIMLEGAGVDEVYDSIIEKVNDVRAALYEDLGFPEHFSSG